MLLRIIPILCMLLSFQLHAMRHDVYDVGVLALRGEKHARKTWQPTIDWLSSQDAGYKFVLRPLDFEQLDDAFLKGELDFILTSPGQATKIARSHPISWIATQTTAFSDIPNKSIASVVVVNAKSDYFSLADIDRKRIGAVSEKAFGGFLAMRYELDQLGYFNSSFFNNIEFTGPPTDQILLNVLDGTFDAGILPACTLESLINEGTVFAKDFRVLNEQRPANSICAVSTPLYPNWTFAMTEWVPISVGKFVAEALFDMSADHVAATSAGNLGWTLPVPSIKVDNVYKHLDLHPLQKSTKQKVNEWFQNNRITAIVFFVFVLVLIAYHVWLEWKFKRSQERLSKTLNDLRTKSSLLEHAQRVTIVGELGSSLAHELNQPLSAINNYSQGAINRLEKGMSQQELQPILSNIQQQVSSASEIIQRLRSLINKKPVEKRCVDLKLLINEASKLVEYEFERKGVELEVIYSGTARAIVVDPTGFQQVIINVLTNAKDACTSHSQPDFPLKVKLIVSYLEHDVMVEVLDNGIGFTSEYVPLDQAFYTTKADGLGLGLAICRDVVESHSGSIQFLPVQPHGCHVIIHLPNGELTNG